MVAGETTTSRQLPQTCALTTPGRSAGVDGGHRKFDPRGCSAVMWVK